MSADKLYEVAIRMIPGIGNVLAKQLISYCGSAELLFKTPKRQLLRIPGIGEKKASAILQSKLLRQAEAEIEKATKLGVGIISYTDAAYPKKLTHIFDAPLILYTYGKAPLNAPKVVSIVGTRKATSYGRAITEEIVEHLAKFKDNLLIVSGLAYGIDIAAHRASLKQGIPTAAVLANGLDTIYPSIHTQTALQMCREGGALLSENPLGTPPESSRFPERNRIVAGVADAVIVVEAAEKGGALITANIAHSYDREVFAIPGSLKSVYSEGCNRLIRDYKAHIYTGIADLEYVMQWAGAEEPTPKAIIKNLPEQQQQVYALLTDGSKHIDEISFRTQIPINQLASVLLNMEFEKILKPMPGKVFMLCR